MTTLDRAREALLEAIEFADQDYHALTPIGEAMVDRWRTALSAIEADGGADDSHAFKNFHRLLCERFDYTHDEKDWRRDQVSLIEWIARRAPLSASVPEGVEPVAWRARRQASNGEWLFWQDVAEDTALHYASQTRTDIQIERLYSADALTRIAAERDEARAERDRQYAENVNRIAAEGAAILRADNLQARLTSRAKSMLRLREALAEVYDNIEDEGDRVYFGSTNDADTFREVWRDLDAWAWDDIMSDGKLTDVYEASRKAHARAEAAEATVSRLTAINATLMGDDEAAPRYTTKRLRQEVERQTGDLRAEVSMLRERLEKAGEDGWNACRKSIYAVCEDVQNEADRLQMSAKPGTASEEQHATGYYVGQRYAAKSIARGFNSMNARDDDNFTEAARRWTEEK